MADLRSGSTIGGRPIMGKEARNNYLAKIAGNKLKESLVYDDGNKLDVLTNASTFGTKFTPSSLNKENMINILVGTNSDGSSNGIAWYESDNGYGMKLGYDGIGGGTGNKLAFYSSDDVEIVTILNQAKMLIGGNEVYHKGILNMSDYVSASGDVMNGGLTVNADITTSGAIRGSDITTGNTQLLNAISDEIYVGNPSTYLRLESDVNPTVKIANTGIFTVWHSGNFTPSDKLNANAKAVDSDKLDGLNSSQFLRSDVSDTLGGDLHIADNTIYGNTTSRFIKMDGDTHISNVSNIVIHADSDDSSTTEYLSLKAGSDDLRVTSGGGLNFNGSQVWHSGNFNPSNKANQSSLNSHTGDSTIHRDWGLWDTNGSQDLLGRGKRAMVATTSYLAINYSNDFTAVNVQSPMSVNGTLTAKGRIDANGDILVVKNNPWLTLDSSSSGSNSNEQGAGISIGESGYKGSAMLHLTYTGDGKGHIGMGSVETSGIPSNVAMRLNYTDNDVTFYGELQNVGALRGREGLILTSTDSWLRINENGAHSSGTYFGDSLIRTDNALQVGSSGSTFRADSGQLTYKENTIWHSGNDGSGSGLDADKLDGRDSGSYALVAGDSYSGTHNMTNATIYFSRDTDNAKIYFGDYGSDADYLTFEYGDSSSDKILFRNNSSGTISTFMEMNGLQMTVNGIVEADDIKMNGSRVWTSGNDGSGSGLDADYVDGIQGWQLLRSDANDTFTGKLSVGSTSQRDSGIYGTYDSNRISHIWSMGTGYSIDPNGANFGNLYGLAYKHTNNSTGGNMAGGHQMVWTENGDPKSAMGTNIWTSGTVYEGGTALSSKYLGINAKASDSDRLDNLNSTQFLRSDTDDTMTGNLTVNQNLTTNGDLVFSNNALVSNNGGSTNIDHIWHNDSTGEWHFITDGSYKQAGNAKLVAGSSRVGYMDVGANRYYADSGQSGIYGLNMNNSDMIGVNGVIFNDTAGSGSTNEGLLFPKSSVTTNSDDYHRFAITGGGTAIFRLNDIDAFEFSTAESFKHTVIKMGKTTVKSLNGSEQGFQIRNEADSAYATIQAAEFSVNSVRESKKNIKLFSEDALDMVKSTSIYTYNWVDGDTDKTNVGMILDEAPDLLKGKETLSLYSMTGMLWKAVQQSEDKRDREIRELKERVEHLEADVEYLSSQV